MESDESNGRNPSNPPKYANKGEEQLAKDFNMLRLWYNMLRGDTMTQKVNKVYNDFYKSVTLPSETNNVLYGQLVQLHSPCFIPCAGDRGLALSVTISEDDVEMSPRVQPGSEVTAATLKTPCIRNTFQILPVEPDSVPGEHLKAGERFMLKALCPNEGEPALYVEAEPPIWGYPQQPHNFFSVRLMTKPSIYCWWKAEHKRVRGDNPREGDPIKVKEEVVIRTAMGHESLAIDKDTVYSTFFGREYGITAHNPNGRVDLNIPETIWQFVSGIV